MLHVRMIVLAIVVDIVDTAANHHVPKVVETHLPQWETANVMAVVIYVSVARVIAKAPVAAVAHRVLQGDEFYLGWEV